ncbi:hypothetical protein Sjap_008764 [Stephania japonica]|uniref:Uncharacterized protein n=1 Tax=Stephania japonica TaxID=461633 RepID=A0AAP0JR01_9MAGN
MTVEVSELFTRELTKVLCVFGGTNYLHSVFFFENHSVFALVFKIVIVTSLLH